MAVVPEGSLFRSWLTKKACKQFAEDNLAKSMNYWNHVLWSDVSKVNLFDSDGVQHVWRRPGEEYQENCALPTVEHGGGSIIVWGCMTTAGTGELRFIEGNMDSNMYCDILKQKMMPSPQKMSSNITTPNTLPRWQLPCCWRWRWLSGQVCLQTWTLLSTCGASSTRSWRCKAASDHHTTTTVFDRWYDVIFMKLCCFYARCNRTSDDTHLPKSLTFDASVHRIFAQKSWG